jgi:hypothetical protein
MAFYPYPVQELVTHKRQLDAAIAILDALLTRIRAAEAPNSTSPRSCVVLQMPDPSSRRLARNFSSARTLRSPLGSSSATLQ